MEEVKVEAKRHLLRGTVTLEEAFTREDDMRAALQYPKKLGGFYVQMIERRDEIQRLVASHCGLKSAELGRITVREDRAADGTPVWRHGSFNVCVRVSFVDEQTRRDMAFRVPLPFKIGEYFEPGNAEEKVRSEAATYIWIKENCPDVPIPTLRGFGVPGGLSFFHPHSLPLWPRLRASVWRFFCRLRGISGFCEYIPKRRTTFTDHGYLITDWIEGDDVRMLSDTFFEPHTPEQTRNLYRDMSRVMLSLSKIPQPRIGSWTLNDQGQISLSSRPGLLHLYEMDNLAIPTNIERSTTYSNADSFYLDLLSGHDNRLLYQPNAIFDEEDAQGQATDLLLMRAFLHQFTDRAQRHGPFVMQLTDLHASNIFVDEQWNIKFIIDLEWACSLPVSFLLPPAWLTGEFPSDLHGPEFEAFETAYTEFVHIFREEEKASTRSNYNGLVYSRASVMEGALKTGQYSYHRALRTPSGLFNIVRFQMKPFFDKVPSDQLRSSVSTFWRPRMNHWVAEKLEDLKNYRQQVSEIFHSNLSFIQT
ncbi:hypothetical protein L228DRAFT_255211 [Xylona heveae TC161]|uniref:Aminoglycoside phosphotransferase domain-containing protein n=1 Tax=Xylona heveae (strain CBS 132557 / TC161) TaxID=1328760 RepID=A0A165IXU5_XYLHT|nr:hypothetical protein L228DRAFT_255211 [Xylona heveae TC161]KZF25522.1 hypothetical protein L228DRAFT_255211 [Xylona heveae TC161]